MCPGGWRTLARLHSRYRKSCARKAPAYGHLRRTQERELSEQLRLQSKPLATHACTHAYKKTPGHDIVT
jgi:hypothetical protein